MPQSTHEVRRTDGLRRVVRTLFEWPWTALGFFVLFFGFLMLLAYFFPPLYQVRALVLVKSGSEKTPLTYLPLGQVPTGNLSTSMEDVNSEVAILTSRPVIEEVVDIRLATADDPPPTGVKLALENFQAWCESIGLMPKVDEREAAILALQNNLAVEPIPISNVIEISYSSFSPRGAAKTVNLLLDSYVKRHGETHRNSDSLAFFQGQANQFRDQLRQVHEELTRFRVENDGGDLSLKRTLLLQTLVTTEQSLRNLEGLTEGSEEMISDSSLLENREVSFNREKLLNLKLELAAKQYLYAEDSRELQAIKGQMEIARQALADEMVRVKASLTRTQADVRAQLQEVERQRARYDRLVEDEKRLEINYDTYLRKSEEERITKAMEADQMISVRVLERASTPPKPYFPNRFVMALLGIFFGVPFAISAALLKGYLYGRVASVEDVERELDVPVLASVRRQRWWASRKKIPVELASAARVVQSIVDAPASVPAPVPAPVVQFATATPREGTATFAASVARAFRDEVESVLETPSSNHAPAHVVYFASASAREGAATFAAAVARAFAVHHGGRTAFVQLGSKSEAERAARSYATRTPEEIQTAVQRSADAPGLDTYDLSQARLANVAQLFQELRGRYERIIVAGPPLAAQSDGGAYAGLADRAVYVVGGSGIHFEVARRALSVLRRAGPEVVGAVLTQRRDPVPSLIYRWM